jgi:hypothetical protein
MTPFEVIVAVFGCLLAAIWIDRLAQRRLPETHLSAETKDTVKLAMGLVATMTALLLGLLVGSAIQSYDSTRRHVVTMPTKIGMLDRLLGAYGEETTPIRGQFREITSSAIPRIWAARHDRGTPAVDVRAGNDLFDAIHRLRPANETRPT